MYIAPRNKTIKDIVSVILSYIDDTVCSEKIALVVKPISLHISTLLNSTIHLSDDLDDSGPRSDVNSTLTVTTLLQPSPCAIHREWGRQ